MFYFHTFTLLLQTQIKLICVAPLWHLISPLSLSLPCSIRCYKEFAEIKTTFVVFILSTPLRFDFRYSFFSTKKAFDFRYSFFSTKKAPQRVLFLLERVTGMRKFHLLGTTAARLASNAFAFSRAKRLRCSCRHKSN